MRHREYIKYRIQSGDFSTERPFHFQPGGQLAKEEGAAALPGQAAAAAAADDLEGRGGRRRGQGQAGGESRGWQRVRP